MSDRLYRSQGDRILGGVCGGLGEYLRIDPVIIRLLFVLFSFGSGVGLLVYLIMWVVVPLEGQVPASDPEIRRANADEIKTRLSTLGADLERSLRNPDRQTAMLVGAGLVFLGLVFLADAVGLSWLHWLSPGTWWPLILIALGILLVIRRSQRR